MSRTFHRGFTMIELVVAITVTAIVAGFMAAFIGVPLDMYSSQSRRAEMDDAAENLWRTMRRDLVSAVPYSVRYQSTATIALLEILPTTDRARYHPQGSMGDATKELDTTGPADSNGFDIAVADTSVLNIAADTKATVLKDSSSNPYASNANSTITISGTPGEAHVATTASVQFAPSPSQQIYFFNSPVTYLCDLTAQTVRRYTGYTPTPNQNSVNTAAKLTARGATNSLIATKVTGCSFRISNPLAGNRGWLMTTNVTFSAAANTSGSEFVRSFHELNLENLP